MKLLGSLFYAPHGQLGQSYYINYYVSQRGSYYKQLSGFAANALNNDREKIYLGRIIDDITDYAENLEMDLDDAIDETIEKGNTGISRNLAEWFKSIPENTRRRAEWFKSNPNATYEQYLKFNRNEG